MSANTKTRKVAGYVYLLTNMVNGKRYVGVTTQTVRKRWAVHVSAAHTKTTAIASAIVKYGKEAFRVETLEVIFGELEDLEIAEIRHIAAFHTRAPSGYNLTPGGRVNILSDEARVRIGEKQKERMADPAYRSRFVAIIRRAIATPEWRKAQREGVRRNAKRPEWLATAKAAAIKRSKDPQWKSASAAASRRLAMNEDWLRVVTEAARARAKDPKWKALNAKHLECARSLRKALPRFSRNTGIIANPQTFSNSWNVAQGAVLYQDQGKTLEEVAAWAGVTLSAVAAAFGRMGISRRRPGEWSTRKKRIMAKR